MRRFPPLKHGFRVPRSGLELRLRELAAHDVPAIRASCADPVSQRWLALPRPYTAEHAQAYVLGAETLRRSGEGLRCAVVRAADDVLVGCVSLKETDWQMSSSDVGYWGVPAFRGQGIISAATRVMSTWALDLGLLRITLRAVPENHASNGVADAAGFRFVRRIAAAGYGPFGTFDLNLYELTRADAVATTASLPDWPEGPSLSPRRR